MKKAAVVVPVYKPDLSNSERFSLERTLAVLEDYDIYLLYPKYLDPHPLLGHYEKLIAHPFPSRFFKSIKGYNKLMMSAGLYRSLQSYKYMLVVQLDALVLTNQLDQWCERNYSYIGAPWFDGHDDPTLPQTMIGCGNGGFSLRRVEDFIKVLSSFRYLPNISYKTKPDSKILYFLKKVHSTLIFSYSFPPLRPTVNEDIFWGKIAPSRYDFFETPPPEVAARFSFETQPSFLSDVLKGEIPFGCHGWEKYEPKFWREALEDLPKLTTEL
ncbi:MAG: DUF5672 family protein [Halioglobus sp.]